MGYCHIHGKHYYDDGCPRCRAAEEQAESDRSDTLEKLDDLRKAQRHAADAINNPGDYACPYCKLRTLLKDASCCPKCQKDIGSDYWDRVRYHEEMERQRAEGERQRDAEEWRRGAAERKDAEQRDAKRSRRRDLAKFYFGYALPLLSMGSGMLVAGGEALEPRNFWPVFVPALNWALMVALLFSKDARLLAPWLVLWTVVGSASFLHLLFQKKK